MRREIFAAVVGLAGLLAGEQSVRGDDLRTISGEIYRHVSPIRVEPDGVTWRHEGGIVKIDFADCPESVRAAYHYEPVLAEAYRQNQAVARQQAEEQSKRDTADHDAHRRELAAAAAAQNTTTGTEETIILRRALSLAASQNTRDMAARLKVEEDKRAAEAHEILKAVPPLPSLFGPRPINSFMDTPNAKEYAASLHRSPTGASGNFVPSTFDASRATTFDEPIYLTRSYYEDVERAAAFARGEPSPSR